MSLIKLCDVVRYIEYCMHRVNMLRHFGVQPVLVFDGGSLPMKSDQEIKRARYVSIALCIDGECETPSLVRRCEIEVPFGFVVLL